jgi:hypothetical protein
MKIRNLMIVALTIFTLANCTLNNRIMREPNMRLNLEKKDFTLSDQVSGEATRVAIFGIDFSRLFLKEKGSSGSPAGLFLANIPIIGSSVADKTASYALYEMMKKNPGYDVVIYPQFESTRKRFLFFYSKTTVKATARLGKLN